MPKPPGPSTCSFCGKSEMHVNRMFPGPRNLHVCDGCVRMYQGVLDGERRAASTDYAPVPRNPDLRAQPAAQTTRTPRAIFRQLSDYVVGQDAAKRALSVAVYNHYKRIDNRAKLGDVEISKSNVLLIGPTGSGKTLLAQTLARLLDVPFAIADATALTEAGYVGDDVESILVRLIQAADGDIERAQRGIVYIDEIDKIARKSAANPSITRDVSGEGVQQALLKIVEGALAHVPVNGGRKHPQGDMVQIDTSDILFICGGTFDGLLDVIGERLGTRRGIFEPEAQHATASRRERQLSQVTQHDLKHFGFIPELIGRLPILITLDGLDHATLIDILSKPKNALLRQYQKLLSLDGVELQFLDDALRATADEALKQGSGARGLRSILERALSDIMYEIPSRRDIRKVVIDAAAIRGHSGPRLYDISGRLIGQSAERAA
jgi:ATP-dependent Clp protease ATP-binding subunit ClpX